QFGRRDGPIRQFEGQGHAVTRRPFGTPADHLIERAPVAVPFERPHAVDAPRAAHSRKLQPAPLLFAVLGAPIGDAGVFGIARRPLLATTIAHAFAATSFTTSAMMPVILKSFGV